MAKRSNQSANLLLTQLEKDKINLGIEIALKLKELPKQKLEVIFASKNNVIALSPIVDAVVNAVMTAVVYNDAVTKFNVFENIATISKDRLVPIDVKERYSMAELINAREQLNKLTM